MRCALRANPHHLKNSVKPEEEGEDEGNDEDLDAKFDRFTSHSGAKMGG